MQVDLLKTIVSSIAGQGAAGIVDLLYNKKNVNEFLIAKKLKLTINQTRNILYKLADEGIVSFMRKKDRKKGGWYIYFWTLNTGKGLLKFKEHLSKKALEMNEQLSKRKVERFYYCTNCQIESNEENALLYQYTCPECGEVLQLRDKGKEIETLEKEISKINTLLGNLNVEIGEVTKKEEAVKVRKQKVEDKKKSKERALKKKNKALDAKRLIRMNLRKKLQMKLKKAKKAKKSKSFGLRKNIRKLFRR